MICIGMCLTVNSVKNYMSTIIDLGVWLEKRKTKMKKSENEFRTREWSADTRVMLTNTHNL